MSAKTEWQRRDRSAFKMRYGFSKPTYYRFGGLRLPALKRDGFKCVRCGMTDKEHLAKWGRPITVDHKNGRRNTLANLQTLCLRCHGMKDGNRQPSKLRNRRQQVMDLTLAGLSCNSIAKRLKVGCRVVTKWIRRWNQGKL